jgi:hypothetical protein
MIGYVSYDLVKIFDDVMNPVFLFDDANLVLRLAKTSKFSHNKKINKEKKLIYVDLYNYLAA